MPGGKPPNDVGALLVGAGAAGWLAFIPGGKPAKGVELL